MSSKKLDDIAPSGMGDVRSFPFALARGCSIPPRHSKTLFRPPPRFAQLRQGLWQAVTARIGSPTDGAVSEPVDL